MKKNMIFFLNLDGREPLKVFSVKKKLLREPWAGMPIPQEFNDLSVLD